MATGTAPPSSSQHCDREVLACKPASPRGGCVGADSANKAAESAEAATAGDGALCCAKAITKREEACGGVNEHVGVRVMFVTCTS